MAAAFAALRAPRPVARWLAEKSPGERRIVVAIAAAVAIGLLWSGVWRPLVRDVDAMRAARATNAERLAGARRMVDESAALARTTAAQAPRDTRAELDRVLARHDLKNALTQLSWQGEHARLAFAAVDFDRLVVALESLQRDAGLRVVEATIAARVEPGMVRADLALSR